MMIKLFKKIGEFFSSNVTLIIVSVVFFLTILLKFWYFGSQTSVPSQAGYMSEKNLFNVIILHEVPFILLLTSLVFLFKRKLWMVFFCAILDVWLYANMIYFRFNGDLMSYNELELIDNMDGFWSSVLINIHWRDLTFIFSTILLAIVIYESKNKNLYNRKFGFALCLVSAILLIPNDYKIFTRHESKDYTRLSYSLLYTPVCHFCNEFVLLINDICGGEFRPSITTIDEKDIKSRMVLTNNARKPQVNVILLIVESLESWPINVQIDNQHITPTIDSIINNNNVLYSQRLIRQVQRGISGDGQFIFNTGLLPTSDVIVCKKYYKDKFFSLGDFMGRGYDRKTIIATPLANWNQKKMSEEYSYDSTIVATSERNDYILMTKSSSILEKTKKPFFLQIITCSSHSPFSQFADSSKLKLSDDMPITLKNYISSVNFADKCIGLFLNRLKSMPSTLENTIVVITGDHTILNQQQRDEFNKYIKHKKLNININLHYTPLIIFGPPIKSRKIITKETYQMDIYPTILSLLEGDNYIWQGMGINLMKSDGSEVKRSISEKRAFELSDKIIKNDYFLRYKN